MEHSNEKFKFQEKTESKVSTQDAFSNSHGRINAKASFNIDKSAEVEKKLRTPRSEAYMQLFDLADVLSATDEEIIAKIKENLDEELIEDIDDMSPEDVREEIRLSFVEEFESLQIEIQSILHGVLSKCYIPGCDCHAISSEGEILEHYDIGGPMPDDLKKGRPLLLKYSDTCKCVEVYSDCCRVIMDDSSVITVRDGE